MFRSSELQSVLNRSKGYVGLVQEHRFPPPALHWRCFQAPRKEHSAGSINIFYTPRSLHLSYAEVHSKSLPKNPDILQNHVFRRRRRPNIRSHSEFTRRRAAGPPPTLQLLLTPPTSQASEVPALILGALTSIGGVTGYVRTGSIPSIAAGLTVGALVRKVPPAQICGNLTTT
jgi:hypothetical protein